MDIIFFGVTVLIEVVLTFLYVSGYKILQRPFLRYFQIDGIRNNNSYGVGILVAYYAWAIYFYNINFGITDKDWDDIETSRNTRNKIEEPVENPNSEETFGLPPGTVRGTIALTLLVGTLAMVLISFGKESVVKDNEVFVDNFDFFKTAFLMMIAFYFGQKSLEYLQSNSNTKKNNELKPDEKVVDKPNFVQDGAQG